MRRRLSGAGGDLGLEMIRQSETLARFTLFRSLAPELIHRLDSQCIWKRPKANEWVLNYEDDSVDLFFVAHGRQRVTIRPVSGGEIILRDLVDGEFFGELAAIDARPHSAGVEPDGLIERRGAIVLLKPSELLARIEKAFPAEVARAEVAGKSADLADRSFQTFLASFIREVSFLTTLLHALR
jgi:hypothetical protein